MEFRIYDPILSSPMLPVFSVKNKLDVLWIGHVYSRSILFFSPWFFAVVVTTQRTRRITIAPSRVALWVCIRARKALHINLCSS